MEKCFEAASFFQPVVGEEEDQCQGQKGDGGDERPPQVYAAGHEEIKDDFGDHAEPCYKEETRSGEVEPIEGNLPVEKKKDAQEEEGSSGDGESYRQEPVESSGKEVGSRQGGQHSNHRSGQQEQGALPGKKKKSEHHPGLEDLNGSQRGPLKSPDCKQVDHQADDDPRKKQDGT